LNGLTQGERGELQMGGDCNKEIEQTKRRGEKRGDRSYNLKKKEKQSDTRGEVVSQ